MDLARLIRTLVRALERPLAFTPAPAEARFDAIVVLVALIRASGPSPFARERVDAGAALFHAGVAPVICVTGGHVGRGEEHLPIEAEGMARWLREAGVPEAALRVDRRARSTLGNAREAARLLLPEGRRRVILVTQPFHARRALRCFRRAGFAAEAHEIQGSIQRARPPAQQATTLARELASWAWLLARGRATDSP